MKTFKERQIEEAINRIKMLLPFNSSVLNDFQESQEVYLADMTGALYYLEEDLKAYVKEFEEKHNAVVYFIHESIEPYKVLNIFFVSKYPEEWALDRRDLEQDCSNCYVWNLERKEFSQFGRIYFHRSLFGIHRIA